VHVAAAVLLVAASYALGGYSTALAGGRATGHDPTLEGSHNPGASNVYRLSGTRAGLVVFATMAFTPLANYINIRMAGVARLEPSDAIVVLGRGGADSDGILTNRSLRRDRPSTANPSQDPIPPLRRQPRVPLSRGRPAEFLPTPLGTTKRFHCGRGPTEATP